MKRLIAMVLVLALVFTGTCIAATQSKTVNDVAGVVGGMGLGGGTAGGNTGSGTGSTGAGSGSGTSANDGSGAGSGQGASGSDSSGIVNGEGSGAAANKELSDAEKLYEKVYGEGSSASISQEGGYSLEEMKEEGFFFNIVEDNMVTLEAIKQLYEVIVKDKIPAIEAFPEEARAAAEAYLQEETDSESLELMEAVTLNCSGYQEKFGAIYSIFNFLTNFSEAKDCVVLVGINNGEKDEAGKHVFEWLPIPAMPSGEDGHLGMLFPVEDMLKLEDAEEIVLVVLSANK